jgi:hypothetical protein
MVCRSEQIYKSECGRYLCRATRSWGNFEVWTTDGSIHWRDDDRIKTWADQALDWHPFEYCTGGFSARMTGQKKGSFTVTLLHCDTRKVIIPWTGNTVIEKEDVVFRRQVPRQNRPKFLRSPLRKDDDPIGRLTDDGCCLPSPFRRAKAAGVKVIEVRD